MKPLAVYTRALEQGYEMFDMLQDMPINLGGYQPMNYDRQFRGQVSMYDAVIHSYNVPPVWLLDEMGLKYGINAVERFGIKLEEKDQNHGLALGGMDKGTSPLALAQAYSAFPNKGLRTEAHAIKRIVDAEGNVIGKWQNNATKVTDEKVAAKMTYMLKGVVEEGTGKNAKVDGWEIAAKTGTTEVPFANEAGTKDHWFVGYTPEIVGAVWMGYDQTDENHYLTESSGSTVTVIFKEIFTKSINQFSKKQFDLSTINKLVEEHRKKEEQQKALEEEKKRKEQERMEEEKKREEEKEKEDKKWAEEPKKKEKGKGKKKEKEHKKH